jgi:hypothetical protein
MQSVQSLDFEIKQMRRLMRLSESEDDAMVHLVEINRRQRIRYMLTGKFLPHSNGKVYYYDTDFRRWFAWEEKRLA